MILAFKEASIPRVKGEVTLKEGIKILFDYEVDSIAVEDKTGKTIGGFIKIYKR